MKRLDTWLIIALIGSLWGLLEMTLGAAMPWNSQVYSAAIMGAVALALLGGLRGLVSAPGAATAAALFAASFRLVNAGPFWCHLTGIVMLGVGFDIAATLLLRRNPNFSRRATAGALSALAGFALFALLLTYVVEYEYWAVGGLPRVVDHIFVKGGLTAVAAAILVPVTGMAAERIKRAQSLPPSVLQGCAITAVFAIWTLGSWSLG